LYQYWISEQNKLEIRRKQLCKIFVDFTEEHSGRRRERKIKTGNSNSSSMIIKH
jgi:hypothetical protein